jgi:hypothetical protein
MALAFFAFAGLTAGISRLSRAWTDSKLHAIRDFGRTFIIEAADLFGRIRADEARVAFCAATPAATTQPVRAGKSALSCFRVGGTLVRLPAVALVATLPLARASLLASA